MEEQLLEVIGSLIEGRNDFFIRTMQLTPHQQRGQMLSRFMLNEVVYLEIINRIYRNQLDGNNRTNTRVLSFTIPVSDFEENVPVVASQAQIDSSIQTINSTTSNCAICQESISSDACQIRQCGHIYHRDCILSWLNVNVRCPVCRHDIRENSQVDPVTQTQPVSE